MTNKETKDTSLKTSTEKLGIDNLKTVIGFILYVAYELAGLIRDFSFTKAR